MHIPSCGGLVLGMSSQKSPTARGFVPRRSMKFKLTTCCSYTS